MLYHLGELAALRGQKDMAEYFKRIGSLPMEWNLDGDN